MASNPEAKVSLAPEVGNWVQGERFWGRESELIALTELIQSGANIAITAPRRIGKTSLMREIARLLAGKFLPVHVDLQGAASPEDLVVELTLACSKHRELYKRALDVFRNALGDVQQIQARDLAIPVVLYLDELAILVNRLLKGHDYTITADRIAAVDEVMSWLRQASIRHAGQLSFVIASSIGLTPVLAQAKLSATLNTFTPFRLQPWDRETARGAFVALANHAQVGWDEGAVDAVLERLGIHVPHHVQVFWRALREDARQRNVFYVTRDDVERVYQADLLGAHGHLELAHYEERLTTTLGSQLASLAVELLSEAAITGALPIASARALADGVDPRHLRDVIDVLVHDGYLQLEQDSYVFSNRLLCDWWRTRHHLTHRPLAERGRHG